MLGEEVRGMADGAGISYDLAFFAALRDGWTPSNSATAAMGVTSRALAGTGRSQGDGSGCTSMCASGDAAGGRVLVGQTKDTPSEATRYHVMQQQYEGVKQVRVLPLHDFSHCW